jgi:hypothetical protein
VRSVIRFHPNVAVDVVRIGREQTPLIVIDNFLINAAELVQDAVTGYPFAPLNTYYPGIMAPSPHAYSVAIYQILHDVVSDVFGLAGRDVVYAKCDFRMVTQKPEDLLIRQRIPHYDDAASNLFVVLHYLARRPFGGTAMYRHRKTGFEQITAERAHTYEEVLATELAGYTPRGYILGDTPYFEKVASVPAAYNRAIIYRGNCLHSGEIVPEYRYDADPRTGRLTANTLFLYGEPRQPLSVR